MLAQRRDQRGRGLGWGRETPAPVVLEALPLPMQVQAERVGAAGRGFEGRALCHHQADSRQPFEPFVRRQYDRFEIQGDGVERQPAERCDRVDDQGDAASCGHLGERFDRVEQAGPRVDVADDHMADRAIGRERGVELRACHRLGPWQLERCERHTDRSGNLPEARAVEAVVDDQELLLARDQRAERRLVRGIADALHGHADVAILAMDHGDQAFAHLGGERQEIRLVRGEVAKRSLFGRGAGGHRAGRKDDPLCSRLAHALPSARSAAVLAGRRRWRHRGQRLPARGSASATLEPQPPGNSVQQPLDGPDGNRQHGPTSPSGHAGRRMPETPSGGRR
jgi:hypothetical protein